MSGSNEPNAKASRLAVGKAQPGTKRCPPHESIFLHSFNEFLSSPAINRIEQAGGVKFFEEEWFGIWCSCQSIASAHERTSWGKAADKKLIQKCISDAEDFLKTAAVLEVKAGLELSYQLNKGRVVNALHPAYKGEAMLRFVYAQSVNDFVAILNQMLQSTIWRRRGESKDARLLMFLAGIKGIFDAAKKRLKKGEVSRANFKRFLQAIIDSMPSKASQLFQSSEAASKQLARSRSR